MKHKYTQTPKKNHLEDEILFRLKLLVKGCLPDLFLQIHVTLSGHVQGREQVTNQTHEYRHVICDDLGDVEITQGTHQNLAG